MGAPRQLQKQTFVKINDLSGSIESADSDPADDIESKTEEEVTVHRQVNGIRVVDQPQIDIAKSLRLMRPGVLGGRMICDGKGCRIVAVESDDASL